MSDIEALFAEVERTRDPHAIAVLADALVEAGDPRGELIHVHQQLAREPNNAALSARMTTLLAEARTQLLGDLAERPIELEYRDGLLDRVIVRGGEPVLRIAKSRDARLLRTLVLDPTESYRTDAPIAGMLEELRGTTMPPSLRRLELGTAFARNTGYRVFRDFGELSFSDRLDGLLDVFPAIEELRVDLGAVAIAWPALASSCLRRFSYVTPRLFDDEIAGLASLELPALESFELWTGAEYLVNDESDLYIFDEPYEAAEDFEDDAELPPRDGFGLEFDHAADEEALEPIFDMLDRTAIRELAICNFAPPVGPLVEAIAKHRFAHQLERLDLSRASSFAGLAAALPQLPNLRTLVVAAGEALAADRFDTLATVIDRLADPETRGFEQYRYVVTQE